MKNVVVIDHVHESHKKTFVVNWSLGNTCNYTCSYCDADLNSGSMPWLPYETIVGFCDEILLRKPDKRIFFEFTGGEVTRFKDLIPLVQYLSEKGCGVGIISNSSRKLDYWEKIAPYLSQVTLSYHAEYCDPGHYFEVVKYLSRKMSVHSEIMMHPGHFGKCEDLGLKILEEVKGVSLCFQALMKNLRSDHELIDYDQAKLDRLNELYNRTDSHNDANAQVRHRGLMRKFYSDGTSEEWTPGKFIANNLNRWAGWVCWTGVEQIVVTSQGDVFNAWCTQSWLGNIKQGNVRFPKYPLVCEMSQCHCGLDIQSKKKWISLEEAEPAS